jgi:hypothetical protein
MNAGLAVEAERRFSALEEQGAAEKPEKPHILAVVLTVSVEADSNRVHVGFQSVPQGLDPFEVSVPRPLTIAERDDRKGCQEEPEWSCTLASDGSKRGDTEAGSDDEPRPTGNPRHGSP